MWNQAQDTKVNSLQGLKTELHSSSHEEWAVTSQHSAQEICQP